MLSALRWRLTFLYLLAATGLVILIGAVTYLMLARYLQQETDLALQYKMTAEFRSLGLNVPAELASAEQAWMQNNPRPATISSSSPVPAMTTPAPEEPMIKPKVATLVGSLPVVRAGSVQDGKAKDDQGGDDEDDGNADEDEGTADEDGEHSAEGSGRSRSGSSGSSGSLPIQAEPEDALEDDLYNSSLSPVFVTPLDAGGKQVPAASGQSVPPLVDDPVVLSNALQRGFDLRTVELSTGARVRLLTYRTGVSTPTLLQAGRLLTDQDRVLRQYLTGLLVLGGLASLLLALVSWWLAGRSLGPAQKAWDQQQTFVSNASHELRTPLTLLRATAEYGLRSNLRVEQISALKDVIEECDYMDHLVGDLLLLSRLDAHRMKLERRAISISDLLAETGRQVEKMAIEKDVTLTVDTPALQAWGDRTHTRQVLLVLLDNALRFTPSGGKISLHARMLGKRVEIQVIDTGTGIPPEHLPHIFERFYQVPTPENEAGRGNGLGLSIAKKLMEAQGGSIVLDSILGQGTNVKLYLPYQG